MSDDPFGICLEPNCEDDGDNNFPSNYQMAKNLLGSAKDIIAGAIHGEGILVQEAIFNERMDICATCPKFVHESARCMECGCFMNKKAMFKKTECPLNLWEQV